MQEILIKGRSQKFARKDTQHFYMVVRPIKPKKNSKRVRVWLKLHYTYTQEDLPVNSNKVATINKIKT